LTVAVRYWFNWRGQQRDFLEKTERAGHRRQSGRTRRAVMSYEDIKPIPNLEHAKEHLKISSPVDKDNNWRGIWETSIKEIGGIGGPGLGLYFSLLVYVGLCFTYQFIFSIPLLVFSSLGDFTPQGIGAFPQVSIGNLGTESTTGVAQENRLVVISCQGVPASDLTKWFGWLDFLGTAVFTLCSLWLVFRKVPRTKLELDQEMFQASDFSVQIDYLPPRIPDQTKYADAVKKHIEQRITESRRSQPKFYKKGTPRPKVCDVVLMHDCNRELGKMKTRAELLMAKEIAEFKQQETTVEKIQANVAKVEQGMQSVSNWEELNVIRAFVTLNACEDVSGLLFQYRFSRFWLFRRYQSDALCFQGTPIRIKPAPEPSNIFWENQDAPWQLRWRRKLIVLFVCVVLMGVCLGLMFATTKQAQNMVRRYEKSGTPAVLTCSSTRDSVTPPPASCQPVGWTVRDVAGTWVLHNSTGYRVEPQNQDTMDCFCSVTGARNILMSQDLRYACNDLLTAYATRLAITLIAAIIVVVINLLMAAFLMFVATWELPLSISELHNAQMFKVFISQTLNTACIVFAVHYENIDDFQRGWYVVIGVQVCMTMTTNTFINAICYFAIWGIAVLRRWCTSIEGKHQAELLQIYTNPAWDMASRYAYLLMTVYVTMIYSSGLPILYLMAALYCISSFWSDKIVLLWGSVRPPQFDEKMAKKTARWLVFAGAIHCLAAVAMYGHPCVFPSNPLGGALGQFSNQALNDARNATRISNGFVDAIPSERLSGTAATFFERLGRDSTWMFSFTFFSMLVVSFFYVILRAVGRTFGEFYYILKQWMCPSRQVMPEEEMSKSWAEASQEIWAERPPASYKMEEHPEFKRIAKYLREGRQEAA